MLEAVRHTNLTALAGHGGATAKAPTAHRQDCLSACLLLSVWLAGCLSVSPSACLSIRLYLAACLSVCEHPFAIRVVQSGARMTYYARAMRPVVCLFVCLSVAVCLAGWLPLCRFACERAYATRVVQGGVRMTLYVRSTRPGFRNNEDPAAGSKARWRRQGFTLM